MTSSAEIVSTPPADEAVPQTIEGFLSENPWPAGPLALGRPLEFLWHFDLDVTPGELWPFVMDTSHFNRAMGMSKMDFREVDGVLHGSTRNAGVLQEWTEVPWTWVSQRTLTCARNYTRGFARHVRTIYKLVPLDDGRRVRFYVYFGWIPRGVVTRAFLALSFPTLRAPYQRVLTEIQKHVRNARETRTPYTQPAPELTPEARSRVDALRQQLHTRLAERRVPTSAADKLVEYLTTADDMDVYRIQIRPLARKWQMDPSDLLVVCLHATRIGLLSLSWDVICPHCRGVREEVQTLGDVPSRGTCEVCEIEFDTDSENSIEITFHLHPSVRDVPKLNFCAAEPATKRHIELQQCLGPRERARVQTSLGEGHFRLRIRGEKTHHMLQVGPAATAREVTWSTNEPPPSENVGVAPVLELVNASDSEQTFVIEDARWSDNALRPVQLFTLQEFRDLFSEEYLTAEVQLSIGEQTILFTDMIGSTRFYDTRGDPQAFSEVKRHFREVYEIVRRNRGAVVKTIGDAVMAAFHQPVDALQASVEIHNCFPEGRADTSIRLRISMNYGPCIAVNLNSNIDYFGRTVNASSKLQSCVEAGQISFPRTMREVPGVNAFLERYDAKLEEVVVTSVSLKDPIPAYRWDVNGVVPIVGAGEGNARVALTGT